MGRNGHDNWLMTVNNTRAYIKIFTFIGYAQSHAWSKDPCSLSLMQLLVCLCSLTVATEVYIDIDVIL